MSTLGLKYIHLTSQSHLQENDELMVAFANPVYIVCQSNNQTIARD